MSEIKKFRYFVKYSTLSGGMRTKIIASMHPVRVWLTEIREVDPEVDEILKCKQFDRGEKNYDNEDTIW